MKVFSAYNSDASVRAMSSSGGVFSALAERVISDGGVVYGPLLTITGASLINESQTRGIYTFCEAVNMFILPWDRLSAMP